jgi:hypothetical protein
LNGRCPNVSFLLGGRTVVASGASDYNRKDKCSDLSNGDRATVSGTTRADGRVDAQHIDIRK